MQHMILTLEIIQTNIYLRFSGLNDITIAFEIAKLSEYIEL